MPEDQRCCGSGTCIIDPTGRCWCGQQWDGEKMVASRSLRDATAPQNSDENALSPSASAGVAPE